MSDVELERFSADLKSDPALREKFAGKNNDIAAIVETARANGYGFTLEDVEGRNTEHDAELSEEELDTVAGGRRSSFTVFMTDPGGKGVAFVHW